MIASVVTESNRYCLSKNDMAIINSNSDKPLAENARKTLTILSEVFGGLHHLDSDQLELFDYQDNRYNSYLIRGSLATFDFAHLTQLVIMAHDMAVRLEIQAVALDPEDEDDLKLLQRHLDDYNGDSDYDLTMEQFTEMPSTWLKLQFHQREREGRYYEIHPTLEDAVKKWRDTTIV